MKARIAELIAALRRAEIAVSIVEAMDAAQAAALAGVERTVLRDALAAALIKDERDRPAFFAAFAATFPARPADVAEGGGRKRGGRAGGDGGAAGGGTMSGSSTGASGSRVAAPDGAASSTAPRRPSDASSATSSPASPLSEAGPTESAPRARPLREDSASTALEEAGTRGRQDPRSDPGEGAGAIPGTRARTLLRLPFRAMTPGDVEETAALARALATRVTARFRRRLAPRKLGRLDFRRTIRAAVPRGGVPFERRYRGRRPGAPDLVALCDLSASTAIATDFFLSLLAPATTYFRHVRLFGFVDRLVEIEFVDGQVRPAAPIDLMARSDFGRVLKDLVDEHGSILGTDTVLLVLGDGRNNRRPPRADLLATARARVRRLVWLNPDPLERWNGGDSVIALYARHADTVVTCGSLTDLERALVAVARL